MSGLLMLWTALGVGVLHTILGPDHTIPFIALSKSKNWSIQKTSLIVVVCGLAHVMSSVVIALGLVALGKEMSLVDTVESTRGSVAGWMLIAFGVAYAIWGVRKIMRPRVSPISSESERKDSWSTWALFLVFVFGPCEPMIPLVVLPALQGHWAGAISVAAVFSAATLATMLGVVLIARFALDRVALRELTRYDRLVAGGAMAACGVAMTFFGL